MRLGGSVCAVSTGSEDPAGHVENASRPQGLTGCGTQKNSQQSLGTQPARGPPVSRELLSGHKEKGASLPAYRLEWHPQ